VDDLLEVLVLKSIGYHLKIGGSSLPVVDLVQGGLDRFTVRGILRRYKLLDLTGPANDGGLKSLDEVTILGVG
jgi:hypothetical protein